MAERRSLRRILLNLLWLLWGLVLMFSAGSLAAQDDLTETATVTRDGNTLTIDYPDGWVSETADGNLYLANNQDALDALVNNTGEFAMGDIALTIGLPNIAMSLGLAEDANPVSVINALMQALDINGVALDYPVFGVDGAYGDLEGDNIPGGNAEIVALKFDTGTILISIQPSGALDETVEAMLRSIIFNGQSLSGDGPDTDAEPEVELTVINVVAEGATVPFEVLVPDSWDYEYASNIGAVFLVSNPDAMARFSQSGIVPAGEIGVAVALPPALTSLGISATADAETALTAYAESFEDATESDPVVADDTLPVDAARSQIRGEEIPSGSADIYALALEGGTAIINVQPGGLDDPTVHDILASMGYGGDIELAVGPDGTIRQWAAQASGTTQYTKDGWSFAQATGEPNVEACGDDPSAWASESATGEDVLHLRFAQPVIPTQINIYQTFNPGSIVEVAVGNSDDLDALTTLDDSADPVGNTPCPGVFTLDVTGIETPVDTVVISLDQSIGGDWNEIDAVELVGTPPE